MPDPGRFFDKTELPWKEGQHDGDTVHGDELNNNVHKARWTLSGMAYEYKFFSAVILPYIGMNDPVQIYWSENNLDDKESPYFIDMERVIFKGLQSPFDRYVFACPNVHADGLFRFLDRVSIKRPDGVWDSVHQKMELVDWKMLENLTTQPSKPPTVSVSLYGIMGPVGGYVWMPPKNPFVDPITLGYMKRPPVKVEKTKKR